MEASKPTEIERIFYENFTNRQNDSINLLLKLLTILGAVIIGYGYILFEIKIEKQNTMVVFFMLIFVEILLIVYFKIIYDSVFAFRRDQIVVYRMLKKYRLIKENESHTKNFEKVFLLHYNPLKKFQYKNGKLIKKIEYKYIYFLLPAFHNTLSLAIFVIHFMLYLSFIVKLEKFATQQISIQNIRIQFYYILIFMFFTTCTIFFITIKRKNKFLMKLYKEEFEQVADKH